MVPFSLGALIEYLLVVPVRFHRVTPTRVAVESAFAEHLRALRRLLQPHFDQLSIAGPSMAPSRYEKEQDHLGVIDEEREGIRFVELHAEHAGFWSFWLRAFAPILSRLWNEVRRADLVHTGISHNLWRPVEFPALVMATLLGRKSICVVDIDLRDDARMNYSTGRWSRKSAWLCRRIYDPIRELQMRFAARRCSLVLLKGRKLCRDYGGLREHVKYFLDSAFSQEQIIPEAALEKKEAVLEDPKRPLELVYFGRLTAYKGVDRCIEAVALVARETNLPVRLNIIGAGEEEANLKQLALRLTSADRVRFHPALPFGPALFEALYPMHLMLAAPLSEDTPRSALDALACGIPILAFDTEYYSDLQHSGAVELVPWPSTEDLARRIAFFAREKQRLIPMARAGIEFARGNTQETWLRSRIDWTLSMYERDPRGVQRVRERELERA